MASRIEKIINEFKGLTRGKKIFTGAFLATQVFGVASGATAFALTIPIHDRLYADAEREAVKHYGDKKSPFTDSERYEWERDINPDSLGFVGLRHYAIYGTIPDK